MFYGTSRIHAKIRNFGERKGKIWNGYRPMFVLFSPICPSRKGDTTYYCSLIILQTLNVSIDFQAADDMAGCCAIFFLFNLNVKYEPNNYDRHFAHLLI